MRKRYADFTTDAKTLLPRGAWWEDRQNASKIRKHSTTLFAESMASCTAVTYVNGSLVGDPLDVQMFEATGWVLDETDQSKSEVEGHEQMVIAYTYPKAAADQRNNKRAMLSMSSADDDNNHGSYKSALIRRFDFSSQLQRMSVICKNDFDQEYRAFVKGSPEKILELCNRESIPHDYQQVLTEYTQEGYRVIALSYKDLPNLSYRSAHSISRE